MTIEPGFGGQNLIPEQIEKVRLARTRIDAISPNIKIEVDGGVNRQNAAALIDAGADNLVAGTALFTGGAKSYATNISHLRKVT